ncbi:2-keto-3-deoxy-6-phosphogluconate aldolase [Paraburkholderia tropica]|uniref:hypothetical protein n=1 Tax=Paraburkholderia tropica TaxID=92647 RepID=UPI001617C97A|nr:hypothetical protein [Paraburkholderia tropica]MBB3001189.1 2-keto-3-deoxy-6-phosphogluconate aldolase [Paraburkholderia tropica]MBB6320821.1 2-keto-3-deoxy-6-phosphogluconate aldolase [Paraburkholderia tropica]
MNFESDKVRRAEICSQLKTALKACPLIAILRGMTVQEAADHANVLCEAVFRVREAPLGVKRHRY